MIRLLPGITHALVIVPSKEDAKASGTLAYVDLCFGPGDDTAITGIRYTLNEERQLVWQVPYIETFEDGRVVVRPVFKGDLLREITQLASASVNKLKKTLGKPAWGQRYRILKDQVLIDEPTKEISHAEEDNRDSSRRVAA
jgi:hypothetical protein